jgi:hypothetical protein
MLWPLTVWLAAAECSGLHYYEDCNHHAGTLGRTNVNIFLNMRCNARLGIR